MQEKRILRWACLDDYSKMNKRKLFYGEEFPIPNHMKNVLGTVFEELRNKFLTEIEQLLEKPKDALIVSGGAYTFFFVLTKLFGAARKKYPLMPIRIKMEGMYGIERLKASESDIVLDAHYVELQDDLSQDTHLCETGYEATRKYFDDKLFFAASKESVDQFGSEEEAVKSSEVLFGRLQDDLASPEYSSLSRPEWNVHTQPRVVIDSYFAAYFLMIQSLGLCHVLSSLKKDEDVVTLGSAIAVVRRRVFIRSDDFLSKYFANQIFHALEKK